MIKKWLFLALAILAAPALVCAYNYWSISASTSPAISGAVTPPSGAGYTTVGSTTNVTSATITTADFTVNPTPAGYVLSYVMIDGVRATPTSGSVYTVAKGTRINHTISAYYATQTYTITTSKTGNGLIDPTVTVAAGSSKSITMTPGTGYRIDSVVAGDATLTSGDGVSSAVYTFTNIQSNKSISVVFAPIPAVVARIATSPQSIVLGSALTIDGGTSTSTVSPTNYTWSVTPAGATITPAADGKTATFSANALGTYTIKLALSAAGATPSEASVVITVLSQANIDSAQCNSCHNSRNPDIVAAYNASTHASTVTASCQGCHAPDVHTVVPQMPAVCSKCHKSSIVDAFNASPHNGQGLLCTACHVNGAHNPDVSATACNGCHLDATGNVSGHPLAIGTSPCVACHDPHSTAGSAPGMTSAHFNNMTSAGYPASYVTSKSTCADCHNVSIDNLTIRKQWSPSAHANVTDDSWRRYDFKTMSGCVQCHTTTGFIAYSSAKVTTAWGKASDKTKEVLSCTGCHSDVTAGTLRKVAPVHPYAGDSGYVNPDVGKSNTCMACHSGTNNGRSITAQLSAFADFTNLPFIDPHYMGAGGTSYGQAGYNFPGRTYNAAATHTNLGALDGSGPCLSCHKNSTYGHKFTSGAISSCTACHGSALDDAALSADKAAFQSALEILRAQLAANGFVYTAAPPWFNNTNWGKGQAGANTMGAAFNYVLLATEPGAYAHNPVYARQLVLDSIDFLDNGQFDDSVTTLAVPNLLASGAISQATADSMTSYKAKDSCTICHGGTAASAAPMATNGHAAHITAPYGPGAYFGNSISACQVCHTYGAATHMNGSVDLINGAGSPCAGCHPAGLPTWSDGTRLACTACHAQAPSVLPNGVAAPYKAYFAARGHGQYNASNQCTSCHDPDSRHISGTLGAYTRLRLLNDNSQCASCHNSAATVRPAFLNMSTHFTAKGGGQTMACNACHDPHGTTNLAMIRTTINGVTINYTDSTNGFVDTVTNRGLCQVCHTLTAHYRAGIPETSHPTSGCLSCHPHNAAGGAFKPFGSCDACHGYPPAPRGTGKVFGVMNNWSSARFEDYSGGGGAHVVAGHIPGSARPSQGWTSCTPCHFGGAANHVMALPIKDHKSNVSVQIDPKYSATPGVAPVYNAATKSCSNVSCHSVQPGSFTYYFPDGNGDPQPNTISYGTSGQTPAWSATVAACTACHANPPAGYVWHSGYHGGQGPTGAMNQCQFCHTDATSTNAHGTAITKPALHGNGTVDVQATFKSSCFGCH